MSTGDHAGVDAASVQMPSDGSSDNLSQKDATSAANTEPGLEASRPEEENVAASANVQSNLVLRQDSTGAQKSDSLASITPASHIRVGDDAKFAHPEHPKSYGQSRKTGSDTKFLPRSRSSFQKPVQYNPNQSDKGKEEPSSIKARLNHFGGGGYSQSWASLSQSVVGNSHLRLKPPVLCQDASIVVLEPRPLAIVCDGAGSSKLSHIGAEAVTHGLSRFAQSIEPLLCASIDISVESSNSSINDVAVMFVRHAIGILDDLSKFHMRDMDDFRCTLLMAIVGKQRIIWIKVGDGFIFSLSENEVRSIGPIGKGEFANQTSFLGSSFNVREHLACSTLATSQVDGLLICSDGAGERLSSPTGERIAGAVGGMIGDLGSDKLKREDVFQFLVDRENWRGTSGDDKSIALLSKKALQSSNADF